MLRNLPSLKRGEDITIRRCLKLLGPCIDIALSCTIDFVDQVARILSLKSSFPGKLSKKNSLLSVKRTILSEWKESEITYIENLTNILDQFRVRMRNATTLANRCSVDLLSQKEELEEEISKLENDIRRHKSSLGLLAASIAPFFCISCQATAHLGIYGFSFHELRDDHILELEYVHAIFDVKTRVIVDINALPEISIQYIDDASNRDQNSIFDFHRKYILEFLNCGKISFQLNCMELQDYLLRLGQILGKLDQCAFALNAINDGRKAAITVDLPKIRLNFLLKDVTVLLTLDLASFQTKMISVSIGGMDAMVRKAEVLSLVDFCNFQSLSKVVYQYAMTSDME